jgi:hypothetical protein
VNLHVGQRVLAHCPQARYKIRWVVVGITAKQIWLLAPGAAREVKEIGGDTGVEVALTLNRQPDGGFTDRAGRAICLDEDDPSQPNVSWIGPQS